MQSHLFATHCHGAALRVCRPTPRSRRMHALSHAAHPAAGDGMCAPGPVPARQARLVHVLRVCMDEDEFRHGDLCEEVVAHKRAGRRGIPIAATPAMPTHKVSSSVSLIAGTTAGAVEGGACGR